MEIIALMISSPASRDETLSCLVINLPNIVDKIKDAAI
jgi:hypothetical protein